MYVKTTNGVADSYPYTIGQFRRDNSNVSFPKNIPEEMLNEYGVFTVEETASPEINHTTHKTEQQQNPSLVDGIWTLGWDTIALTAEEITEFENGEAERARYTRDNLLAETDYMALSDVTLSAEMTTYRQALRDITAHANWPFLEDSDWPAKPV